LFLVLVAAVTAAISAQTQSYPIKPIKIVVPLTAGSPVDLVARLTSQHLVPTLGQPVVIENRPGAGATIGAKAVASAEPDGYALLLTAANHVISPAVYKNLAYDSIKDFAPIGGLAMSPFIIAVAPSLPVNNLNELIAYAHQNPRRLDFGFGFGTARTCSVNCSRSPLTPN
jgi:tripartite-type tricarboxylate transporter receptor subunit TctC